jgi:hypothetical protein
MIQLHHKPKLRTIEPKLHHIIITKLQLTTGLTSINLNINLNKSITKLYMIQ